MVKTFKNFDLIVMEGIFEGFDVLLILSFASAIGQYNLTIGPLQLSDIATAIGSKTFPTAFLMGTILILIVSFVVVLPLSAYLRR